MSRFGAYDFDDNEADEDYVPPEDPEDDDDDDDDDDEEMALVEDEEDLPHHGVASVLQTLLETATTNHPGGPVRLTIEDLQSFLRRAGGRSVLRGRVRDEDEEDAGPPWTPEIRGPMEAGIALLKSGEFGRIKPLLEREKYSKFGRPPLSLSQKLRERHLHRPGHSNREDISQPLVPNTHGTVVAKYTANPYSGQYSADSSLYYTCVQDFKLHIYDTSAPPLTMINNIQPVGDRDHTTTMKTINTIQAMQGGWTITDSHLSPDNERMIYAHMSTSVFLTKTRDGMNEQTELELADQQPRSREGIRFYAYRPSDQFRIYSCRFSADGKEIVAGGTGNLFVYDLQGMRRTVRIAAHDDDVNSCCWADSSSGNVLISASDDTFLNVWDRRSLGAHAKPAGVLVGHTEGITYVSPKGDGRYVISNGKDQTMRLWDLRKMTSHSDWEALPRRSYGLGHDWDYRQGTYRTPRYDAHPNDCSVMAYRGHQVLRTLIRCHFSPDETTGGSYLYTGSSDGRIHIYSLDGQIVQVIDRSKSLPISYDPSETEPRFEGRSGPRQTRRYGVYPRRAGVVRDVSWHGREPVLMSVAWGGGYADDGGDVAKHEWKDLGKRGMKLEDVVAKDAQERCNLPSAGLGSGRAGNGSVPGAFPEY